MSTFISDTKVKIFKSNGTALDLENEINTFLASLPPETSIEDIQYQMNNVGYSALLWYSQII